MVFDGAASLDVALAEDVREAAKRWHGIVEALAQRFGCEPATIYKRLERGNPHTILIEAVVALTGGARIRARLETLAATAPTRTGSLGQHVASVVSEAAELNAQLAEDLSPDDDTPGRLDAGERERLLALVHKQMAALFDARSRLREGIE